MKKIISLLLCVLLALSLFACGSNGPGETTAPLPTELGPEPTEAKDFSKFAGIVEDPKTWYDNFMALPIANDNMTEEELRQLCVDAFAANLTFKWTPNQQISYTFTLLEKTRDVLLPIGCAYSGLSYSGGTGEGGSSYGTVWKALPYYDKETGTLDVAGMGEKVVGILTSACANGAMQGWNRVSNSHNLGLMASFNQYDSNIIPVGPYTYTAGVYGSFSSRTASNDIIAFNGDETMYESYANMKMADGVYSSSSFHVMMCSVAPVVVRDENGKIDPERSYLHVHEQGATGSVGTTLNYKQPNGFDMRPLGTLNNRYTFKQLKDKGYIPFTVKELIGEDPVEPGKAWIGTATTVLENGADVSLTSLSSKTIFSNYALCTVEVQVKNPDGQVLVSYDPGLLTAPRTYDSSLMLAIKAGRLQPYANGKNTIHIYARLANGELVEAFNSILKG